MKITKTQLKQIIKEELAGVLDEADAPEEEEDEGPELKSAGRGKAKPALSISDLVVKDRNPITPITPDSLKKEKENKKK